MRGLKGYLTRIIVVLIIICSGPVARDLKAEKSDQETPVIAHFHLSGVMSESPVVDPFGFTAGQMTSLKILVSRIDEAADDNDVQGIVLTYDQMSLGIGQLEEIRSALKRFKAAGKKVYVHAEGLYTGSYSLLCVADRLNVAPESSLWLTGLYGESLYVRALLNKIGVYADYMHMGDYKSAGEMLTRSGPSEPAAENINWLLDGTYEALVAMIAESRGKSSEQVKTLIDQGPYLADQALAEGLIDAIETREAFLARLKTDFGETTEIDNRYGREKAKQIDLANPFAFFSILSEMFSPPKKPQKDAVGIVYVEGMILPGHSQPTLFGVTGGAFSGDIRKALEIAAKDDTVKAVVMRINSPGGSAEASEVILNASRQVQLRKPLIVSMGDVAGSGGYYIACAADMIFADTTTITASIGVVGGKLVTTAMWNKLGVNWVGYKRGANSDLLNGSRRFDESQRKVLSDYMEDIYEVFKGHVTTGRGSRLRKPIDAIAGGRVYTGGQALELGLVDRIGGLKAAIDYAASKAAIEDYEVRVIPRPKDFLTMLMGDISGEGESPTDIAMPDAATPATGLPAAGWGLPSHDLLGALKPTLQLLQKTEPQRAAALYQALQRIELIRTEGVIMMMPFDMVVTSGR